MANTTVKYKGPMTPDESEQVDNPAEDKAEPENLNDIPDKKWVANYVKGFMAGMMRKGGGGMGGMGGGGLLGGM